ncbi:MAG TPA: flagellar biosynthetic protein FliO [Parvularculaceae bacterium]|nr:flagellar biosynthetic protein FliO [Parvularculaceae bacterium]
MDLAALSRIAFALIAVLGMIGLCGLAAKKLGIAAGAAALSNRRRLQLVETMPVDARRRAAIIRCDGREHLVIMGPASETVIETDIPAIETAEGEKATPKLAFADAFALLNKFARNPYAKKRDAA